MTTEIIKFRKEIAALPATLEANTLYYVRTNGGYDTYLTDMTGSIAYTQNAASATSLATSARNELGTPVSTGTVVYLSGISGNKPLMHLAKADAESTSTATYGLVQSTVNDHQNGFIISSGLLTGIDTLAFNEGDNLWLSPTTAGQYTTTKPSAPNHMVFIGIVTRSHRTQGSILVRIQNGYELEELHNVQTLSAVDGDTIIKQGSQWVNTALSTVGKTGDYNDLLNTPNLDISLSDISTTNTYYFGGIKSNGDWQINKWATLSGTKTTANILNNSAVLDLASAWTNKTTLTYS